MKFIVNTQSFCGGDFFYSTVNVEDSDKDEIIEQHHWWHDDKIHIEHDQDTLKLLVQVYKDLGLKQFGMTDYEDHNGEIIKKCLVEDDYYYYIIPFDVARNNI